MEKQGAWMFVLWSHNSVTWATILPVVDTGMQMGKN